MAIRAAVLLLMAGAAGPGDADALIRAAQAGDQDAMFALGRAYKMGEGVGPDAAEAARWFEQAVKSGHAKAGAELGLVLFQAGKGGEALPWLRAAAHGGDPRAQYALGTILYAGKLIPADPVQAKRWMAKAAKAGLRAAEEALAIMSKPVWVAPEIVSIEVLPPDQGIWSAQLAAFAVPENARRYWREVSGGVGAGLRVDFTKQGALTLLRVAPFASRAEAARFCAGQRRQGRECLEVRSRS
jgi:uncharacterized protein